MGQIIGTCERSCGESYPAFQPRFSRYAGDPSISSQIPDQIFPRTGLLRSRSYGGSKNREQCGVMFRKERFKLLDKGTFWLSETPKEPGSKSWDSSLPRIASWVKLDKNDEQQELVFINTHFDHRGRQARIEAAKLIRKRVAKLGTKTRVIITGDFNAGEGSLPYKSLVGANPDYSVKLIDTYRSANPEPAIGGEGTLSAWSGRRSSNRIDWVLHSPSLSD